MASDSTAPTAPVDSARSPPTISTDAKSPLSQSSVQNPMNALQASLLAGKFSDLTIIHGKEQWIAHKVVVLTQSTVLESLVKDREGTPSVIDLKDYPQISVGRLMQYLYTTSYTTVDTPPEFVLASHVGVFNLATTFAIFGLQTMAEERFRYTLNNHVTYLIIYFNSVKLIYDTTPRDSPGLRNAVVEAAVTEMKTLLNDNTVKKAFFEIMADIEEFQTDVLMFLADNPNRHVQLVMQQLCEDCGPMTEGNKYFLDTKCRGCEKEKSIEFY